MPAAGKDLRLTLEIHLPFFIQLLHVLRNAGIEDRIEPIPVGTVQIQGNQRLNLFGRIYLVGVKLGLQGMRKG